MFKRLICGNVLHHPEKLADIGAQARKTAEAWPVERGVKVVVEQAAKILSPKRNECEF
jgi:hypothetical protein